MIRIMRFSSLSASIIDRSGQVLPALVGPLTLVISSLHIFTYIGMFIWGSAVDFGIHNDVIERWYGEFFDFLRSRGFPLLFPD